jgi:MSHA biogenesis protein MshI
MDVKNISGWFKRSNRNAGWFVIAVGDEGVNLVQVKNIGGRLRVKVCIFYPAENISPATLEKLRKDLHIGNQQFSTLLNSGEYQILMVDAPNVPADELKTAIRWKIKDALNCHVDDATIDVLQIPGNKFGGDRPQSLYAVAASNDTLRKRISLFEKAKINLSVIDIPEMAQRNLAALFETEGFSVAMLTFSGEGGLLTFTSDGELLLSRRTEIRLGQLLDADENLRQQHLGRVELEVQRSLDYFDRQFHHVPVKRFIVAAPQSLGLEKILAESLGLPVEQLDLAQVMDTSAVPELSDSEFQSHVLYSLGAALRQERRAL